jgi:hypothetical protein
MEITVEPDLLLCISPDNRMLHVGPAAEVLPHVALSAAVNTGARAVQRPAPLEVFDVTGRRVAPEELQRLADAGTRRARQAPDGFGDPDRFVPVQRPARVSKRVLLRRIYASLDFAQAYLTEHPEAGNQGPSIPPATQVPRPVGTYPEVLQALAAQLAPLDPDVQSNRGNWFHNLWHAANGTS